ncbi:MAG: Uma2 family endonuclease [Sphingomonas sp.]|nr:Uma2 family endonuclease [Sphingomonas sp.]
MPEPDIVLTRWRGKGPVPVETVALVVEVADTTLASDLGRKADLYAAAGIPEYWVIDLTEARAFLHASPAADGDGDGEQIDVALPERLMAATIAGLEVEGAEVTG